ncbi:ATP synthase F0 subcomplex B subunit [Salana multivorans]|uniref:ATP synthase subunit b n=1 Tax=Salana multivorans TaxID=120377 RepID=A0A3N2D7A1_9MICO|nr:F0F1 ATP synthase subunit B [Salana multivorans]MBN8883420.1 F0F1 ATP synthase subunit B [Salana multivorans]OJX98268.1 MAG: F0F1 ATP synthase subunit B [Micrococcales bacterium 73-15]ROR95660.1 ATP synthase F0 subcomplex B subunit [Salana multivorans]
MEGQILAADPPSGIEVFIPADYDIIWSLVVSGVIAFFFIKYLMPKMTAILDERTAKIEGGLEHAAKVQAEADAAKATQEAELVAARQEAARIREGANGDGAQIVAEARSKAQAEAQRILEAAQRQIDAERTAAVVSLRTDIGSLATELAGRIVGESLSDDARQSRIIDRFLDELDASSGEAVATVSSATDTLEK